MVESKSVNQNSILILNLICFSFNIGNYLKKILEIIDNYNLECYNIPNP